MTTAVAIGDFHAGSEVGLDPDPTNAIQEMVLDRYKDAIKWAGKSPDILLLNGDLVDGEQKRGRGKMDMGHLETQIDKAIELIEMWSPKKAFIVAGTQYHVGGDTIDAESMITKTLKKGGWDIEFHRKLNMEVNGWFRWESRHHLGSSGIPHGRHTASARVRTWSVMNNALDGEKWPHLFTYSHVHYFQFNGDAFGTSMSLPAWQAVGGRYGDERCDGHVDLGIVKFEIPKKEGDWSWQRRLYKANVVNRTVRV